MKKFLLALMCGLIGVILGFGCYMVASDRGWIPDKEEIPQLTADTTMYSAPVFYSVQGIQKLQADCIAQFIEDSVFRCMPSDIMQSVATVVLKRDGQITIRAIIEEYNNNPLIYNTLIAPEPANFKPLPPDEPVVKNKNDTAAYQVIDTTINGTAMKIAKKI